MTAGRIRNAAIAALLLSLAAPAAAQPQITPASQNERLLLEMLRQQQEEIRALKARVERLDNLEAREAIGTPSAVEASDAAAPASTPRTTPPGTTEEKPGDSPKITQTRESALGTRSQDARVSMTTPGPRIESASGDFSMQVVGAIQADAAGYEQSDRGPSTPKLHGGTNIRRLHIGIQGTTFRTFHYALVFDAAGTGNVTSGVRDANVSWVGLRPFTLTLGQQKPNVGLEPNFSDRSNASTFMEPGFSASLITAAGTRAVGAKLAAGGEHYSASIGVFGDDITNSNIASAVTEGWGPAGRVTLAAVNKPGRLLHVGASGFWRKIARAGGGPAGVPNFQLRYRAQPEITVDSTRLVDTGTLTFAESVALGAAEAAGVYGPFSLQAEWAVSRLEQQQGRPSLTFHGGYGLASWFLTGESRVYDGRTGVFTRFSPRRNFTLGADGWGALELATRCSFLDLDSDTDSWVDNATLGGARGGEELDFTLGLNWYLNPWLRLMLDYVHADVDNFTVPAAMGSGVDEGGDADIVAVRVHQEW